MALVDYCVSIQGMLTPDLRPVFAPLVRWANSANDGILTEPDNIWLHSKLRSKLQDCFTNVSRSGPRASTITTCGPLWWSLANLAGCDRANGWLVWALIKFEKDDLCKMASLLLAQGAKWKLRCVATGTSALDELRDLLVGGVARNSICKQHILAEFRKHIVLGLDSEAAHSSADFNPFEMGDIKTTGSC
ncbi:hypothetical protein C8A00DRAFT_31519 [Chaetomidium leptoderma]|uniref:Uncharacterized protein n=1 Tax=Chaetomidium leptoderma TaxID=669021 RepID=A0AAN7A0F1_9PEZI|nr:hypothetical protein C8A00DRAFT_31519 [Chaetomidium leptoderma]